VNNDISQSEAHKQQMESTERHVGVAQEPEILSRPMRGMTPLAPSDFPVRIVPKVEIVLGATLNTVNDVVEHYKTLTPLIYGDNGEATAAGEPISLFRPLSTKNNGAAVQPLQSLYTYLEELAMDRYLIVADEAGLQQRIDHLIECLSEQLQKSFGGQAYEEQGLEFSIARRDYFAASVTDYRARDGETVNTIQLIVRVDIHAASLTSTSSDPAEAISAFDTSYRKVIKNMATATKIKTSVAVAFDVSNFTVRPNLLTLFNVLCTEEGATAKAVNKQDKSRTANVMVSVALTNPNAKAAPAKKVVAKAKAKN